MELTWASIPGCSCRKSRAGKGLLVPPPRMAIYPICRGCVVDQRISEIYFASSVFDEFIRKEKPVFPFPLGRVQWAWNVRKGIAWADANMQQRHC
jgi:hypothetical protein